MLLDHPVNRPLNMKCSAADNIRGATSSFQKCTVCIMATKARYNSSNCILFRGHVYIFYGLRNEHISQWDWGVVIL
jgi:hypothetical protein